MRMGKALRYMEAIDATILYPIVLLIFCCFLGLKIGPRKSRQYIKTLWKQARQ